MHLDVLGIRVTAEILWDECLFVKMCEHVSICMNNAIKHDKTKDDARWHLPASSSHAGDNKAGILNLGFGMVWRQTMADPEFLIVQYLEEATTWRPAGSVWNHFWLRAWGLAMCFVHFFPALDLLDLLVHICSQHLQMTFCRFSHHLAIVSLLLCFSFLFGRSLVVLTCMCSSVFLCCICMHVWHVYVNFVLSIRSLFAPTELILTYLNLSSFPSCRVMPPSCCRFLHAEAKAKAARGFSWFL